MNNSKRLLELDVLRGIAALGVVLFHYTTQYNIEYGHSQEMLFNFPYGKYGVELFFLISGFVIFMSLERTKKDLDFLVWRFSRLYPAYWASVILTFVTTVFTSGILSQEVNWRDFLVNLTMLQEFFKIPDLDGSYWTLGVELSFYVIMFALYKAKLLKYIDTIVIGWLLLLAATIFLEKLNILSVDSRIITFLMLGRPHLSVYANLFIAGMMLYKIYKEGFSAKRCGIIIGCIFIYKLQHFLWESLILASFILIFYMALRGNITFIKRKPLIFIGSISYTLYLVHQRIGYTIIKALYKVGLNPNISIFIAIIISILLAMVITFLIEKPAIRIIREQYKKEA